MAMASAEEGLIPAGTASTCLVDQPSVSSSCCAGWRVPRRYAMVLALSSMFSFGTHVAYKSLSGVSSFLEADLSTDSVGYGVLNSAVSWSALACTPFVTGFLIDAYPTRFAGAGLSLFVLLGHLFFCLAVHAGSFGGAVTGRAVFGVGEGLCRNHVAQTSAGWLSGGSSQRHRSCPQADPEPRPALTNQPLPLAARGGRPHRPCFLRHRRGLDADRSGRRVRTVVPCKRAQRQHEDVWY